MLKPGTLVILIATDGFMPPLGAYGEIVAWDDGDYEVLFPHYPCPVPPGITWYAAPYMLLPVGDKPRVTATMDERVTLRRMTSDGRIVAVGTIPRDTL